MCHVMTAKRCDFHDNTSEWKDGEASRRCGAPAGPLPPPRGALVAALPRRAWRARTAPAALPALLHPVAGRSRKPPPVPPCRGGKGGGCTDEEGEVVVVGHVRGRHAAAAEAGAGAARAAIGQPVCGPVEAEELACAGVSAALCQKNRANR
jgi:hypothetical protein